MEVIEVNSKKTIKDFQKVPWKIYKNDKNWIPHLKQDIEKVFDPTKNKAHRTGKIIRWILIDNNKEVLGRIVAFISNVKSKKRAGGIGFFECINNQDAANLLFETAKKWLYKYNIEHIDGPINFGEKHLFWGLLVDNFVDPNSYGMNYNPPYYRGLFESFGFEIYYKQFMYKREMAMPVQDVFTRKHAFLMKDPDYRIENVRKLSLEEIGINFQTVYNSAWAVHKGFEAMHLKTAHAIMKNLKPVYDPDIMVFVYHKNKPIAFYINIPELNEIFKYVNGNLNWIGKIKFLYHKWKKTPRTMVGIVFGVAKEYQGTGAEGALIKWSEKHIVSKNNYDQTVLAWIGDFNPTMLHVCENLGANVYRTYHTYRYLFDRNKKFERLPILK
ncbi:MAG: hypothetical protein COA97_03935 [Flavobacteriales bacterium]|nr:MAG: hypothetical protein COA97_03935 [Flavobacteriales bacterium]